MSAKRRQQRHRALQKLERQRTERQAQRQQRTSDLDVVGLPPGAATWAEGESGQFSVLYVDPPWETITRSEGGQQRSAVSHYQTMPLDAICALPIPAADEAILFLWTTVPHYAQALDVLAAWGFSYCSQFVWVKTDEMPGETYRGRLGMGRWNRNLHELLIVARRGTRMRAPLPGDQLPSVIGVAPGAHSEKPELFARMIERLYPDIAKLEMFARTLRTGWTSHGNQLPLFRQRRPLSAKGQQPDQRIQNHDRDA